ncbi:MAG: hypothetical protein IKJ30_05085 [Bacilli bacterium]|nr:hypothetical protein [Bacilli bacterium]
MSGLINVVPSIVAIVYTILDITKTALGGNEKFKRFIPLTACLLGIIIGIISFYFVPGVFETNNLFIAIVIGAASGLSATGANQAVKQLTKQETKTE